jgi:hypothetical protein
MLVTAVRYSSERTSRVKPAPPSKVLVVPVVVIGDLGPGALVLPSLNLAMVVLLFSGGCERRRKRPLFDECEEGP